MQYVILAVHMNRAVLYSKGRQSQSTEYISLKTEKIEIETILQILEGIFLLFCGVECLETF